MSPPSRSLNWSVLKDFLAVAESGSLSAAARQIGVSQPTLTRRMAALEDSLQAELFRRSPRGLDLTEAGEAVMGPARKMERDAQELELAVTGRDQALVGNVRITATEGLAAEWLAPALARFRGEHPRIEIEILVRSSVINVLRGETDIAVRLGGRPRQMDLVTRRVGELVLGLYASRAYLDDCGTPRTREELRKHRGVMSDERNSYSDAGRGLERSLAGIRVVYRASTLSAQLAAIRADFGIGGQCCFLADRYPDLVRVLPETEVRLPIWLVTHPGLRRTARIRAVYDFLAAELSAARPLLAGELAPPARAEAVTDDSAPHLDS